MDPFDDIEEKIRRKEKELEAREIKARLKELENELEQIPVTPTYKHNEQEAPATKEKSRGFLQQMNDVGKFVLIVFSVVVAIRVAAWVGFAIMMAGVVWVSYKIFLEKKA
ncbi:MAG: hypothetical protein AB8B99_16570 [Phormidesmis sp.]